MAIGVWTPRMLTDEENYALNYAMALIGGKGSKAERSFQAANKRIVLTDADKRRALQRGLNGLMAKGIVEAKKDGHQDWIPTVLHLEKLSADFQLQ